MIVARSASQRKCRLTQIAPRGPWLAQTLMFGFVVARLAHFWAYATRKSHEVRATFYTIASLSVIYMSIHILWVAVR